MSVSDSLKQLAATGLDTALDFGIVSSQQTLTVNDTAAQFLVTNHNEYLRARSAMGERHALGWLARHIDPGDHVWDVGAAVGTYSIIAALHGGSVMAFEPVPINAARIEQNAVLNDVGNRITVVETALAEYSGQAPMQLAGDAPGEGTHRLSDDGDTTVPVDRGDAFDDPPDVLKIDVEGAEQQVLAGLGDHLTAVETVLVETHPQHDVSPGAIATRLSGAGLEPTVIGQREAGFADETYVAATRP